MPGRWVVVVAVLGLVAGPGPSAHANEAFASGMCTVDVSVDITGATVDFELVEAGPCDTVDGPGGVTVFSGSLAGDPGFECVDDLLAGGGAGTVALSVVDAANDPYVGEAGMLAAGAAAGATLAIAFETVEATAIVAGIAILTLDPDSPPCDPAGSDTLWTGVLVFNDPVLP